MTATSSCSQVAKNLFVSDIPTTVPPKNYYSAILSLLTPPRSSYPILQPLASSCKHYLFIPVSDTDHSALILHLPKIVHFLSLHHHYHHSNSNRVLVHCFSGVSRSVCAILAYTATWMTLDNLKTHHPIANPTPFLLEQVEAFLKQQHEDKKNITPLFSSVIRRLLASSIKSHSDVHSSQIFTFENLCHVGLINHDDNDKQKLITCKSCRTNLIQTNLLQFSQQQHNQKIVHCSLPRKWMIQQFQNAHGKGKLKCTHCAKHVGQFDMIHYNNQHDSNIATFMFNLSAVDVPTSETTTRTLNALIRVPASR